MTYLKPLNALADPSRQAIFERLRQRPCSVGELAAQLPISQPAVSQHLRVLRDAGLVEGRRQGARRIYSLRPQGVAELRAYVESLWDDVLAAFRASAASDSPTGGRGAAIGEVSQKKGESG